MTVDAVSIKHLWYWFNDKNHIVNSVFWVLSLSYRMSNKYAYMYVYYTAFINDSCISIWIGGMVMWCDIVKPVFAQHANSLMWNKSMLRISITVNEKEIQMILKPLKAGKLENLFTSKHLQTYFKRLTFFYTQNAIRCMSVNPFHILWIWYAVWEKNRNLCFIYGKL